MSEEDINNLYKYVLEKEPCAIKDFDPTQIPEIYEALKDNNLKLVRCIILNMLNTYKKALVGLFYEQKIPSLIKLLNIQIIGEESNSKVFTLAAQDQNPFAVGKYSTNSYSTLSKEIVIGLLLNTIHEEAPNFMYTYGGFVCSFKGKGKKFTMCQGKEKEVGIFENVEGTLLSNFKFGKQPLQTQISIFMQIIHSLQIAYERFGFKHNDLNFQNVIIKVLPKAQIVKINSFSILTNVIPVIIDYGCSEIFFEDKGKKYSIRPQKSNPLNQIETLTDSLLDGSRVDLLSYISRLLTIENHTFSNFSHLLQHLHDLYTNPSLMQRKKDMVEETLRQEKIRKDELKKNELQMNEEQYKGQDPDTGKRKR